MIANFSTQQVGNKDEYRCLSTNWYKEFAWVHVCNQRKAVYCLSAHMRGVLTFTKRYDTAFFINGFKKKAVERFRRHETSKCHGEAILKLQSLQSRSIINHLNSASSKTQAYHRQMLLMMISSLLKAWL